MKTEVRSHTPYCTEHSRCVRSERYDAYYCGPCDEWAEEKCGNETCEFCAWRPERPSQAEGKYFSLGFGHPSPLPKEKK